MRKTFVRRSGALLVGLALVATACGSDKKDSAPATTAAAGASTTAAAADGSSTTAGGSTGSQIAAIPTGVKCSPVSLAFLGATSGDNGNLGTNMVHGAQIAVDEFDAANPDCKVTLDAKYDSQGDPVQATPLADTIIGKKDIIALIGPAFSGETKAVMPKLEAAGLPMISPSATNSALSTNGWKMFHRVLASDSAQGPGIVALIKNTIKGTKVGVIDDASDYGKGLADSVRKGLGALDVKDATIDPKAADYSAAITAVTGAKVDTVFYGGYYAEAAKLVTQLRDAGFKGTFVSGDGSHDPGFATNAGSNGEGAYLTTTGAPATINPAFQKAYNAKWGSDPLLYSPESYDIARVFLAGIAAGKTDRASMAAFVSAYDAPGITKQIKFDANGEPAGAAVYYSIVKGGKLVSQGLIPS
ncbi:MAG: branched-chain amino acid ABC transporter substrate-binding protein [Ilumatobacteraceae bacterium]